MIKASKFTTLQFSIQRVIAHLEQGFTSHSTQNRPFRSRSSQPVAWLGTKKLTWKRYFTYLLTIRGTGPTRTRPEFGPSCYRERQRAESYNK